MKISKFVTYNIFLEWEISETSYCFVKIQVFIYLSFEICDTPTQTGTGPDVGQPQNAVLLLPCQRGSRLYLYFLDVWFRGRTESLQYLCISNQPPEEKCKTTPLTVVELTCGTVDALPVTQAGLPGARSANICAVLSMTLFCVISLLL